MMNGTPTIFLGTVPKLYSGRREESVNQFVIFILMPVLPPVAAPTETHDETRIVVGSRVRSGDEMVCLQNRVSDLSSTATNVPQDAASVSLNNNLSHESLYLDLEFCSF